MTKCCISGSISEIKAATVFKIKSSLKEKAKGAKIQQGVLGAL